MNRFRVPELFLGCLLTVAVFAIGVLFDRQQATQSQRDIPKQETSDQSHKAESPDADLAESPWLTKDASGFFTFWLALIGIGQAGLFFIQLRYMRKGMDDAAIAANAAKDSVNLAKATAERQLRAYVGIVSGHLAFEARDMAIKPKVTIRIKNFGQTPAYDVCGTAGVRNAVRFSDELNKWATSIGGKNTVFPQTDQRMLFGGDFNDVPGEEPVDIFVFGRITYMDAFGRSRWTNFRFTAHLDASQRINPFAAHADLAPCEEGNEAT